MTTKANRSVGKQGQKAFLTVGLSPSFSQLVNWLLQALSEPCLSILVGEIFRHLKR